MRRVMGLQSKWRESRDRRDAGQFIVRDLSSHGFNAFTGQGNRPRRGRRGFYQNARIRYIGADRSRVIAGGCRAIMCEACYSHDCYALLIEKGNGEAYKCV